jgi:hypothetical protein
VKNLNRLSLLAALLTLSVSVACADTISLGSFATGTTAASLGFNSSQTAMDFAGYTSFPAPPAVAATPAVLSGTASTFALTPTSLWANAIGSSTWVGSAANAGPGGTDPAYGFYQFTTKFTALGGPGYAGTIDLMADDTAEVLLNGVVIIPFGPLGADFNCATSGITCTAGDVFSLTGLTLLSGIDANTLTFVVEQAGNEGSSKDPSGLDFTAAFAAPEPGSLILLGTGLIGGAGFLFVRRRTA